ncbi:MAG: hypothetical protein M1840_001348 [Geoglossum simile]|nr:MAG: hypothetical protein M1840_001348 [Geoglossum simile]
MVLFTAVVSGKKFSLDLVFGWRTVRGDTTLGWTLGLVWLLNSVAGVIFLLLVVSRSKLIPDFVVTLHVIHLLVTTLYSHSLPRHALWWLLQATSAVLMASLGMWSCQWRELRPINFGGGGGTNAAAAVGGGSTGEAESVRGSSGGSGRDSAGEYELVAMKESAGENV